MENPERLAAVSNLHRFARVHPAFDFARLPNQRSQRNLCVVRFVIPIFVPGAGAFALIGGLVGALAVVAWWLFFSRATWSERVGAIVLVIVALFATSRVVHKSIATGMMGMLLGDHRRARVATP